MTEPLLSMKNLRRLEFDGSRAKTRDGWGLLLSSVLGKSAPDPRPCWGLVLSSLNRLCSLRKLSLRHCGLCEGDIPHDIGCLSLLEELDLGGNNFVSLPESIRCLSKLWSLNLERCKSLQVLPHLPAKRFFRVHLDNCTSLRGFSDPSKLSSRFTNLYDIEFFCLNCIALVQDEGWIKRILSRILNFATQNVGLWPIPSRDFVVCPGSEIPEWFSNQSVGHSVNVELPPPSSTNWLGIAFCVGFEDLDKNLANPAAQVIIILKFDFLS